MSETAETRERVARAGLRAEGYPVDWTVGADGRTNSSVAYESMVDAVAELVANMRIGDDPNREARLLVSQLAHVHGLAPRVSLRDRLANLSDDVLVDMAEFSCINPICHKSEIATGLRAFAAALLDMWEGGRA